ncbi:histidine kinase, partial [Psychroserpens sp.]|uniref:sensor histidine kinase n=1 Tax=Psychroserpens sp. TaxID=2020870 RepID=UPI003C75D01E
FYEFDLYKKRVVPIRIPEELQSRNINHISFRDDELWISTDQGIQIHKYKNHTLEFQRQLFTTINVTKIITDVDDNFWITTIGEGIFVIPNIHIFQYNLPNELLNINNIEKIASDRVLIGTNNGKIVSLNTETIQLKLLDSSSVFRVTDIVVNLKEHNALVTKEDRAYQYNLNSNTLNLIVRPRLYGAKCLTVLPNEHYVLSSYRDAFLLDQNFNPERELMRKRSYTNYYSATTNSIYIGAVEGLFMFDEHFEQSEITFKTRSILAVSISETQDKTIWVSTFNNGVFGIKDGRVAHHYDLQNGLLSNKISCIKADGNTLWIATEKGVQLLDVSQSTFRNLTKQNGIPTYRISDIEIMGNQILFASNVGLFGLNKDKAFRNFQPKPIYFTNVTVNDSSYQIKDQYTFRYNENQIEFSFNTNGLQSNINTRYEYRLLNMDTIWKRTNELVNTVSYNSLPNGNYTFQVKSIPNGKAIKSIQFSISKPFWKRWWFYLLVAISSSVLIYTIFTLKIRKLKQKQTEVLQKELLNKRLVFSQLENLRSQMNPHFIFNALNSIQEYIVLNEKDLASSYLIKFSRLIRIYLDHSREDNVLLSEEIKALEIYLELEKNRFEDLLDYTITVFEDIKTQSIKIPSLFVQPYVENALKHGLLHKPKDRQLTVVFKLNETKDALVCSIEDNGIGIKASMKINASRYPHHRSFATSANEKRVELLNTNRARKITVDTVDLALAKATGTRVVITIPFFKTTL